MTARYLRRALAEREAIVEWLRRVTPATGPQGLHLRPVPEGAAGQHHELLADAIANGVHHEPLDAWPPQPEEAAETRPEEAT